MNKYNCFDVKIDSGIAHITMNKPDTFNSMTRIFWKELPEIVKDIDKNADARVIVLSGEGKHFSAGMDLANFVQLIILVKRKIQQDKEKPFIMKF